MYLFKHLILFILIIPILFHLGVVMPLYNLNTQAIEIITPSNNIFYKKVKDFSTTSAPTTTDASPLKKVSTDDESQSDKSDVFKSTSAPTTTDASPLKKVSTDDESQSDKSDVFKSTSAPTTTDASPLKKVSTDDESQSDKSDVFKSTSAPTTTDASPLKKVSTDDDTKNSKPTITPDMKYAETKKSDDPNLSDTINDRLGRL